MALYGIETRAVLNSSECWKCFIIEQVLKPADLGWYFYNNPAIRLFKIQSHDGIEFIA